MNKRNAPTDPSPRAKQSWEWWPHVAWIVAVLAFAAAVLVLWSTSAAGQTRRGEQAMQAILSLRPDPVNGAQLYARHCASCHGALALGSAVDVVPALAGQLETYLVKQLVDTAEGDREVSEMHRVLARAELVEPQAIRDVTTFISALEPNSKNEIGPGRNLARGQQVYAAQCATCHQDDARGLLGASVPALTNQHYSYLLSQMRGLAIGHRYSVDVEVIERLEALSLSDLAAVADVISRKTRAVGARVPQQPNGLSESPK